MMRRILPTILLILAATAVWAQSDAEPYRIGVGDVLQLNVMQQPSLDRSLQVRPDGTAVVPMVGKTELAGLTVAEAEEQITQKLRLFNRDIRDVSLTMTEYNAWRIYVLGGVVNPGSYAFDAAPDIWEAVREAGGVEPGANVASVRVVSRDGDGSSVATYDLTPFLTGVGPVPDIALRPGDTIMVPTAGEEALRPEVGVQVFGQVRAPGIVPLNEPAPLMSVLMLAGAPMEDGELKKVWWVHRQESGRYVSRLIDVKSFVERGSLEGNPMIHPGDTVQLTQRRPGFWRSVYPILLGTLTTAATVAFALHRIQN